MSLINKLRQYCDNNPEGDLMDFGKSLNHQSPTLTLDVVIELNNLLQLKTAIINNLLAQEIAIPVETLKMILDFLMKDHEETNQKFYLQAFLYTTKRNLTLDYDAEKEDSESVLDFFVYSLRQFVENAKTSITNDDYVIKKIPEKDAEGIKSALTGGHILRSFLKAFSKIPSMKINAEEIKTRINELNIYSVKYFLPSSIRGITLMDGFLICESHMALPEKGPRNLADILTVSLHETAHYLVRRVFNDFNFSSPHKNLEGREVMRQDSTFLPLEMGREVELIVYSGIQPDWQVSSEEGARQCVVRFGNTKENEDKYREGVLFSDAERRRFNIRRRKDASPSFGVDYAIKRKLGC